MIFCKMGNMTITVITDNSVVDLRSFAKNPIFGNTDGGQLERIELSMVSGILRGAPRMSEGQPCQV
jgi:hypothetical protein